MPDCPGGHLPGRVCLGKRRRGELFVNHMADNVATLPAIKLLDYHPLRVIVALNRLGRKKAPKKRTKLEMDGHRRRRLTAAVRLSRMQHVLRRDSNKPAMFWVRSDTALWVGSCAENRVDRCERPASRT